MSYEGRFVDDLVNCLDAEKRLVLAVRKSMAHLFEGDEEKSRAARNDAIRANNEIYHVRARTFDWEVSAEIAFCWTLMEKIENRCKSMLSDLESIREMASQLRRKSDEPAAPEIGVSAGA